MQGLSNDHHTKEANREQGLAYVDNGYLYETLPTPTSIRLLEFESIQNGLPRIAKMHVVDLNDNPEYTALSYTWGTQDAMKICICDGHQVKITQNLAAFLQRFYGDGMPPTLWYEHEEDIQTLFEGLDQDSKLSTHLRNAVGVLRTWSNSLNVPSRIWIDSICINQENPVEVNQQIPLMGDIYRKAGYVNIWLGEHDVETTVSAMQTTTILLAIHWCQKLTSKITETRLRELSSPVLATLVKLGPLYSNMCDVPPLRLFEDLGPWKFIKLFKILDGPYFTRAWTYQESNLASRRLISLGPYCLRAGYLQEVVCYLGEYLPMLKSFAESNASYRPSSALSRIKYALSGGNSRVDKKKDLLWDDIRQSKIREMAHDMLSNKFTPNCCHEFERYDRSREGPRLDDKTSLLELLAARRGAQCTIHQDLVYSLLGLASDGDRIVPGLQNSWQELFIETVAQLVQTQPRSLYWLFHQACNQSEVIGLPSWVPDWRTPRTPFWTIPSHHRHCPSTYRCSVELSDCKKRLHIRGYIEDVIKIVRRPLRIGNTIPTERFETRRSRERRTAISFYFSKDGVGATGFGTKRGQNGVGPSGMRSGDEIAVIWGVCAPLILRPQNKGKSTENREERPRGKNESATTYRFIGECNISTSPSQEHPDISSSSFELEPIVPEGREEVTIVLE